MEDSGIEGTLISDADKGKRLAALLGNILQSEEDITEEDVPESEEPCSLNTLEEIFNSAEKIRGAANRMSAAGTVGPEQEVYLTEVLADVMTLEKGLSDVISDNPLFRTNLIILKKLIGEYDRIDKQIDDFISIVGTMSGIKLTGERSRVRDNLTQLVTERWRLLNSVLDNVNKLHTNVVKARIKGSASEEEDLFSGYAKYAEGKDYEQKGPQE